MPKTNKLLTVAFAACMALAAHAGPDESAANASNSSQPATAGLSAASVLGSGDQVLKMLQDKGIVPTEAPQVINRMRDAAGELVMQAMNFLGVPYRRGGSSELGFDCSGFTRYLFATALGVNLPRRADEQARSSSLLPVKLNELRPGDLVFFNTLRATFSHVGIYVGEGKFIHSPRSGSQVRVEDMRIPYWSARFDGARRVPAVAAAASAATASTTP